MAFYRLLLRLYPSSFRGEYAEELTAAFAAERRGVTGLFGWMAFWLRSIGDVVANAAGAHFDLLRRDLSYGVRTTAKAPGFAATVVLVSMLGVGAATAVFTVTDYALLRPFRFQNPERLVMLWEAPPGYSQMELSPPNYRDWKQMSQSFDGMAAFQGRAANVVGLGEPRRLEGAEVEAGTFRLLGVAPAFGRGFDTPDGQEGAAPVAMLSYGLWQTAFGADPGVIGSTLRFDGIPHTITGVMPADFNFPSRTAQFWTVMQFNAASFEDRANNYLRVIGRLKDGVTVESARLEMSTIAARLAVAFPETNARSGASVIPLRDQISDRLRTLLVALLAASGCLVLIACTNLASLLLARSLQRRREIAVRTALGAGRERLIRQLLTESLLLAGTGGIAGIGLAYAALPLLARLVPTRLPMGGPEIDPRALAFALALTTLTGLLFGVLPAWRASGTDFAGLRDGSRAGGGRRERLRSALVIAEVAASVVLLASSGLLIRALWRIQSVDPGFHTEGVITLRTALPMPKYDRTATRTAFYQRVLGEVRRLPGVKAAGYTSFLPIVHGGGIWPVVVPGMPRTRDESVTASLRFVTPGFFAAMGIPLFHGREVLETDTLDSRLVAIVSESFAQRHWPGQDPIGRSFEFALNRRVVAGVVRDIRVRGLEQSSEPQVYVPYRQVPDESLGYYAPKDLVIRTDGAGETLIPAIRRIVRAADPEQPVSDVQSMTDVVAGDTNTRSTQVSILGAFAAVAFLLAATGIHGLLSYTVSSRGSEIGVRLALGAQRSDILGMVVGEGARLALAGIAIGLVGAWAAGRALESVLAGVAPFDLPTFVTAIGVALAMTLAGTLAPAVRATRVEPVAALRAE